MKAAVASLSLFFMFMFFLLALAATHLVANQRAEVFELRFTNHAMTSHADAVTQIKECFDGGGSLSPWYKMDNGRWAQFCFGSHDGKNNMFRIYTCDGAERVVVTQFKQAAKKLTNYMTNHNFQISEPPPCY